MDEAPPASPAGEASYGQVSETIKAFRKPLVNAVFITAFVIGIGWILGVGLIQSESGLRWASPVGLVVAILAVFTSSLTLSALFPLLFTWLGKKHSGKEAEEMPHLDNPIRLLAIVALISGYLSWLTILHSEFDAPTVIDRDIALENVRKCGFLMLAPPLLGMTTFALSLVRFRGGTQTKSSTDGAAENEPLAVPREAYLQIPPNRQIKGENCQICVVFPGKPPKLPENKSGLVFLQRFDITDEDWFEVNNAEWRFEPNHKTKTIDLLAQLERGKYKITLEGCLKTRFKDSPEEDAPNTYEFRLD